MTACADWEKKAEMEVPQGQRTFPSPVMQKRREMAHPVPTKAFLQPSLEATIWYPSLLLKPVHLPLSCPLYWHRT